MEKDDILRELEKIRETLGFVNEYLSKQNESNAALHLSTRTMYSPLTAKVQVTQQIVEQLYGRIENGN